MKAERLITEPFEFVQMNQCEIKKEAGEHGHAVISGYISADNEKGYLQMASVIKQRSRFLRSERRESAGRSTAVFWRT